MSSNATTLADVSRVGLGYGIAIAVGILVLISTIMLASYVCVRVHGRTQLAGWGGVAHAAVAPQRGADESAAAAAALAAAAAAANGEWAVAGIDQATLDSYPKIIFSRDENEEDGTACSICLSDYKESEVLRMLPDCHHVFHVPCIDAWLRMHATCPMCRTSPLATPQPTPMSTPLSELIPLARHPLQARLPASGPP